MSRAVSQGCDVFKFCLLTSSVECFSCQAILYILLCEIFLHFQIVSLTFAELIEKTVPVLHKQGPHFCFKVGEASTQVIGPALLAGVQIQPCVLSAFSLVLVVWVEEKQRLRALEMG